MEIHDSRPVDYRWHIMMMTKRLMKKKNSLLIFIRCILHQSHPVHWDQAKGINLSVPRVKTHTDARVFHSCAPSLWNNLPLFVCSAVSVATFKKYLKTHIFNFGLSLLDIDGPFMLQNCFIDFAVEHGFRFCATENGFVGDIGAMEIWMIDWIESLRTASSRIDGIIHWSRVD